MSVYGCVCVCVSSLDLSTHCMNHCLVLFLPLSLHFQLSIHPPAIANRHPDSVGIMNLKTKRKVRYYVRSGTAGAPSSSNEKQPSNTAHVDLSCPICQEPVGQRTPEGVVEGWSQLPCGHKFGSHCIKHWLGMVADDRPCCPVCRQNACHACGHPVLPAPTTVNSTDGLTNNNTWRWFDRSGGGCGSGCDTDAGREQLDTLQYTNCAYCQSVPKQKKILKPLRLAKGCWQLIRHGRLRPRTPLTPELQGMWLGPRMRDPAWEKWWNAQEPRNA